MEAIHSTLNAVLTIVWPVVFITICYLLRNVTFKKIKKVA